MKNLLWLMLVFALVLSGCEADDQSEDPAKAPEDPGTVSAPYDPEYPANPVLSTLIDECTVYGGCHLDSDQWLWIRFEKYLNDEAKYNPKYNFDKVILLEYTGPRTTVKVDFIGTMFASWAGGDADMLAIRANFKANTKYKLVVGDGVLGLKGEFGGVKYNEWTNL